MRMKMCFNQIFAKVRKCSKNYCRIESGRESRTLEENSSENQNNNEKNLSDASTSANRFKYKTNKHKQLKVNVTNFYMCRYDYVFRAYIFARYSMLDQFSHKDVQAC